MNCGLNLAPLEVRAMSLTRSITVSRPLASRKPASPVRSQPSAESTSRARRLVAEVASEQAAVAGVDLADAAFVRVDHAQLGVVERHARAVAVELGVDLQRVGAGCLGLAIELPQRHAHGEKEAERVGAERGPAGRRRLQIGEAQPVAQGREQQQVGQPVPTPSLHGRGADADRPLEQPPRQRAGVQQACAHIGRRLLPHPWRQQQVGRADLAQIAHRRLATFGKAHPDAAQQRHRHDVDLLHDPGQRQDRNILVRGQARVGAQVGRDVRKERPMLQHGELGLGGSARGGAQDRDVLATP